MTRCANGGRCCLRYSVGVSPKTRRNDVVKDPTLVNPTDMQIQLTV
jgi:hypothetical protein